MKRFIIWFLQTMVLFSLGVWAPAMAAGTDQTHLSKIVKTKQTLLIKATARNDMILPAKMALISAYEATLEDIQERAHQLRFLIAVSESNPFEVSMYFKQAAELRDEYVKETRAIRGLALEIQITLGIIEASREDLRFIAQTAVSTEQKQDALSLLNALDRLEAGQMKIKQTLDGVLARSDEAGKK
ncbi:MAG TPA: hypothetical protein HPP58_02395, partial [Deltaproteobacteria bacterium]|nr:hypothetical protein [Deltaproteobacteria bacterium]